MPGARSREEIVSGWALGIHGKDLTPERLVVAPYADLQGGEPRQAEGHDGREAKRQVREPPGDDQTSSSPAPAHAGSGQERPAEAGDVAEAVGNALGAVVGETDHGEEEHDV